MHLSANWKPNYRDRTKQAVKKLHLCGKMAADKKKTTYDCCCINNFTCFDQTTFLKNETIIGFEEPSSDKSYA